MRLKYLDGKEYDDPLFDLPLEEQRKFVAAAMNLAPGGPWPDDALDKMLAVRRIKGRKEFFIEIGRMMTPDYR